MDTNGRYNSVAVVDRSALATWWSRSCTSWRPDGDSGFRGLMSGLAPLPKVQQEPLVVKDKDGRYQEDFVVVYCFCCCGCGVLLGGLLEASRSTILNYTINEKERKHKDRTGKTTVALHKNKTVSCCIPPYHNHTNILVYW